MPTAAAPTPEQPVSRAVLLDAPLDPAKATRRVEVREIRMLPGHPAGTHVHNGPVFGSIVAGTVIFQIEGGPESVLGPGDVFFEPEGARITRFDAGPDPVTFLGYFLLAAGEEPALVFPDR